MKGDIFTSFKLWLTFGSGKGRVYEVYPNSVKVIYLPETTEEFVDVLQRLQVGDTFDGCWSSAPTTKTMTVLSAPCRWSQGEIYLHLKF